MKLSLVFNTLASMVVLATAYPTQGPVVKRSNVEKREELNSDLFSYEPYDFKKREEGLDSNLFSYEYSDSKKREELNSDLFDYDYTSPDKREEPDPELFVYHDGKR